MDQRKADVQIFHLIPSDLIWDENLAYNGVAKIGTVLFAISDQSTCLWALLVATLMGVSKISNNTVLRKYIGLQHIQRSGS